MSLLQTLIDTVYRNPKSKYKTIKRFGGYVAYNKMLKHQEEMIEASIILPEIPSFKEGLQIYFLTGEKYLYQTLFCALSLTKACDEKFQFILVDDGSFNQNLINRIEHQMPGVKLILTNEIEANLNRSLPLSKYPFLHRKREIYPHIKKLTDIHTIDTNSYKLVLDSDMLFWNEPAELINWLKNPSGCLHMIDCEESYGYDKVLMSSLCGYKIPEMVNVGAIGFNSNIINWQDLEIWAKTLEEKEGTSYFLEQALSAMIIASEPKSILNKEEYIVNPVEKTDSSTRVKLHHYVDLSKKYYFESLWKKVMK